MHARQHIGQRRERNMQQAGIRPHRVIGLACIELGEFHHSHGNAEPRRRLRGEFCRAVGRRHIEAALQHLRAVAPAAAAKLQNLRV